jgi:LmbE family N-acetylglucosaminyl deacetylase
VAGDILKLMVIGAHPDDAEYKAGGLAALYRELGHDVLFVSVTDGSAGHHVIRGAELAARRRAEAQRAASVVGLTYEVWSHPDGQLVADLSARHLMIRAIRRFQPDLVLTHRPNDYHPDHRATSLLVQDAAYLLTVPPICPDVPHLRKDPVIAYLSDDFTRPYPFTPTVIIDIGSVFDAKVNMLAAHESQFFEWLPYNSRREHALPVLAEERLAWLRTQMEELSGRLADRYRAQIVESYGEDRGRDMNLIEAFEASEYGAPLDEAALTQLFPFAAKCE